LPTAEIVTIGTELLLGEIVDTNSAFLARGLREVGLDLYRMTTVGDNPQRIAQAVREALARADVVITTGGLGPTVDDPTRRAIAQAVDRPLVFSPQAWRMVQERYAARECPVGDNARQQAYVPQGARLIPNPVGTAPGFIVETEQGIVITLPGVPREMEAMFTQTVRPYLRQRFPQSGVLRVRHLVVEGVPEAEIDARVRDLEAQANPTLGLMAKPGRVTLRLTAKAPSRQQAEALLDRLEAQVRQRLDPAWPVARRDAPAEAEP